MDLVRRMRPICRMGLIRYGERQRKCQYHSMREIATTERAIPIPFLRASTGLMFEAGLVPHIPFLSLLIRRRDQKQQEVSHAGNDSPVTD